METWMDEKHKSYFYTRVPLARYLDHGDVTEQLRRRRQCKSWAWYIKEVVLSFRHVPAPLPSLTTPVGCPPGPDPPPRPPSQHLLGAGEEGLGVLETRLYRTSLWPGR